MLDGAASGIVLGDASSEEHTLELARAGAASNQERDLDDDELELVERRTESVRLESAHTPSLVGGSMPTPSPVARGPSESGSSGRASRDTAGSVSSTQMPRRSPSSSTAGGGSSFVEPPSLAEKRDSSLSAAVALGISGGAAHHHHHKKKKGGARDDERGRGASAGGTTAVGTDVAKLAGLGVIVKQGWLIKKGGGANMTKVRDGGFESVDSSRPCSSDEIYID